MAIVLALCSALLYGVSDYCGGRASRTAPSVVVAWYAQLVAVATVTLVVVVQRDSFPEGGDRLWSVGAGLGTAVAASSFFYALSRGAMTVVAPVTAVTSALVPVGFGLVDGERPSVVALAGVAAAVVAVALVSGVGERADRETPPLVFGLAVVAGIGFGTLFVALDRPPDDVGMWPLWLSQITAAAIVTVVVLVGRFDRRPSRPVPQLAFAVGLFAITANALYIVAAHRGLLSVVAVVVALYPTSTVTLAVVLDHERITRTQISGLALAATALVLVTLGS